MQKPANNRTLAFPPPVANRPACPNCGDLRLSYRGLADSFAFRLFILVPALVFGLWLLPWWAWLIAMAMAFGAIWFPRRRWRCVRCGYRWP